MNRPRLEKKPHCPNLYSNAVQPNGAKSQETIWQIFQKMMKAMPAIRNATLRLVMVKKTTMSTDSPQ
jgi:hypothetical protein